MPYAFTVPHESGVSRDSCGTFSVMRELVKWLHEQLDGEAEDVEESRALSPDDLHWSMPSWLHRRRLMAEIEAKRQILDAYVRELEDYEQYKDDAHVWASSRESDTLERVVRLLAVPYAEDPGYRDEWRPVPADD